jgi:DNA-binding MarR family transcriptional regulator
VLPRVARLGLTRGAISKPADRLIQKKLISRENNAKDLRAHSRALTSAGRALVPTLAALADENDAEFFGHITAKERAALERALRNLVAHHGLKSIPVT